MIRVRSWLKTNRWSLIAIAVLGTASVWWSLHWYWELRYLHGNPTQVTDVARGQQGTYSGAGIELWDLRVLESGTPLGDTFGVPDGTDVVVADVRITPPSDVKADDFNSCDVHLLASSSIGEREWWPEVTNPTTYGDGDPNSTGCNLAAGTVYTLREFFIVPAGGADIDPMIQVTTPAELPLALHLH